MNTLKPCPFCGGTKICTEKGINLNYCDNCSAESNIEHWNTRPIEDDLRNRIAELEAEIDIRKDQLREAKNILIDKNLQIDSLYEEGYKLQKRIAELEAERRWIPVSERLPEENKCVLVYDAGGNMTVDFLVTSGEVEKYFWLAKYRILFWMPLPESPNDTQTQAIVYGKDCD